MKGVGFPLLFVATCTPLLKPAAQMTDSYTHVPIDREPQRTFPLVVMTRNMPHLVMAETAHQIPPLPAGSSYLIPIGADRAIQDRLNEQIPNRDGGWKLDVERITPGHQRIELYWLNDGYSGGAYDATATSITPLYWKITGPGYAFIFGGPAMLMTAALWLMVALLIYLLRQIQGSSPLGP